MRCGLPPKTTAAAGSSHGRYADPARPITARSARLPGTSEPISSARPSARAPPIVASSSVAVGESASARSERARAPASDGPELVEEVVGRHGGDAVGPDPDPEPRGSELGKGCDAAAEERIRAGAVGDGNVVPREQLELVVGQLDAVRGDDLGSQQAGGRETPDPGLAVGLDQELRHGPHGPFAALQPVELVLALVEVRHHRDAERKAGRVHLRRAGVRRVRRDADAHALGERGARVLELLLELPHRLVRIRAEDLQVDDRAQPELGARVRARAREGGVADGRDPGGEALRRPEPGDRLHLLAADPRLALDVEPEPGREGPAVAEAGVDRVLEVGVRVDEPREDRGVREVLAPRRAPRSFPPPRSGRLRSPRRRSRSAPPRRAEPSPLRAPASRRGL